VHHHPLILAGIVWWAMLSVVVRLDGSALIVGLAPTLAVIVGYTLAKRQAAVIAASAGAQVREVHTLVNSQRDEMMKELAARDAVINGLREQVALLSVPATNG
jgi:hypothetical protein